MKLARLATFIRDYIIAIASFLFIFLLTLIVYAESKSKTEERSKKLFELKAAQASAAIELRMHDYLQILVGAKAFYMASDTVQRESWKQYYESLHLEKNYPGIQGLGFAQVIDAAYLPQHTRQVRAEGFPEYKVWPEEPRQTYTSIVYLEPFTGRNLRAFGFDMYTEPVRRSAMQMARDTKLPGMTGKVRLVQETGEDEQAGFLIYLPVYKNNADPVSIKDRQHLVQGYIYSPFRINDLMQPILADQFRELDVEIYDGPTPSKESVLYSTDTTTLYYNKKDQRPFYMLSTLSIGNHTWRIYCTANPRFALSTDNNLPFFILFGGLIIGLLMFFIIWSLTISRRSNRLKQTITDNATAALFMMDADGYCTFMNPAAEEMTGYTMEEFRQKPMHDLIHYKHPDGSPYPRQECPLNMVIQNNKSIRAYEDVFIRKDGVFVNVMCAARPISENGKPTLSVLEVRDITDEKRAQQAIIESEARFRTMADNAPVMIWVTDAWGNCMYVNKQWLDFTGQSFKESINMGWHQALHPKDLPGFERINKKAAEEAESYRTEFRVRRQDGEYRWVVSTGTPRLGADGEFLGHIGSILDITEIKEAQKKVKQNAELIQKLFLEVPALVGLVRAPDKQYVLANPLYKKLYGNRLLVGKTVEEAHPESEGAQILRRLNKVFKTGKPFIGNEVAALIDRANNGVLTEGYFNQVYQPLVNGKGKVEAVLMFAVEVTELVAARKKLLLTNEELSQKNTELLRINDDLDSFVYTASHDLKSPIANMEGLVTLLRDILQGKINEEDEQVIDMVTASIHKLKQTIADLAEITKVQKDLQASVEPLAFQDILEDVTSDISNLVEESGANINTDFQEKGIMYARKNLRSIIYNLMSNGIKYRSPERVPELSISTHRDGDFVVLQVADNGLGIRKEQQQKLFSMFRRFHSHVEGTGIGLYIIKRIIENNGGRIEVASELGQGTTFTVYFKQEPVEVASGMMRAAPEN
ncbi:CHASE domain-containing protein [Pontibacter beigongshangensis]|uniref:CHASE domain-containing protein n=1 Tax=Pontibacter beigongshangensis TaxID=2574733 RepID=UPI0016500830|nr:CHASE domain-containing protein [Pontibacter beigongshangensis]